MNTFPMPNATESVNLVELGKYFNNVLYGNLFGIVLLTSIFVLVLLSTKQYGAERAFSSASFLTAIISYMFFVMGWVGSESILITTTLTGVSIFFLYRSGR